MFYRNEFSQMVMYSYESLLTQSRQYQALVNLRNLSISAMILNPCQSILINRRLHKNSSIMASYLEKNQKLFNPSQREVLSQVIKA